MRVELLKRLLAVPSRSRHEEQLVRFIGEHLRESGLAGEVVMVTDPSNNVCLRKGRAGIVPCVAAHLDTVQPLPPVRIEQQDGILVGFDEYGRRAGIGADDKAGVFVCLELLERFDDLAVILFAGEEIGCVGAQQSPAEWFRDIGYIIEFDSPGSGLVSYTSNGVRLFANGGEFIAKAATVLATHGYDRWQHHPVTDVAVLRKRFGLSCLNLSCGYHQWHRPEEYLVLAEVEAAVTAGAALLKALGRRAYPFPAGMEDVATPMFPVTGLQVYSTGKQNPGGLGAATPKNQLSGATEGAQSSPRTWLVCPQEVEFMTLPVLDRLNQGPFQVTKIRGRMDLNQLAQDYAGQVYRLETGRGPDDQSRINQLLLRLEDDVFVHGDSRMLTVYGPTAAAVERIASALKPYQQVQNHKPGFWIVNLQQGFPDTSRITVERTAPVSAEDLRLNYGEGFLDWEKGWIEQLRVRHSGVSILFGPPGTGKTSYLRGLMTRLLDAFAFYYIPSSAFDVLTNPAFVSFWIGQQKLNIGKHRIAIMEDAEELLLPRDAGSRAAVSNLLNMGDGFLGEHLNLQIVCTTNMHVREFDPALLRPGRLMGAREFRRLTRPEAQRLAETKKLALSEQGDFSLAELYCGAASHHPNLNPDRQIGFAQ